MAGSTPRTPQHRGGPGRDTPRTRTAARQRQRANTARSEASSTSKPNTAAPALRIPRLRGLGITWRAIALLVVAFILVLSYAQSLRVYFNQQAQIAEQQTRIAESKAAIDALNDEIARWQDDNYVRAQVRARMGWVVPGETGYVVIGPDGKPLGNGAPITTTSTLPDTEHATTWWERLLGSIKAADQPGSVPTTEPGTTSGGASSGPTPSPTPTR